MMKSIILVGMIPPSNEILVNLYLDIAQVVDFWKL